jgi:hypothetical protein
MSKVTDKILKDSSGYKYKFPQRSCNNCRRHPCFIGQDNLNFDFAKYGCCEYS